MRHVSIVMTLVVVLATPAVWAQTRMTPTTPGTAGDPQWQAVTRLTDGRIFVTDGGMAIDAAVAKVAKLPDKEYPGKIIETYLAAPHQQEYGFGDLKAVAGGRTYDTPIGIPLNATYINYLRRILPVASARFRLSGELQPVVIIAGGSAVGVLMPVRK